MERTQDKFYVYQDGVDMDQSQPLCEYTILGELGQRFMGEQASQLQSILYKVEQKDAKFGFTTQYAIKIFTPQFISLEITAEDGSILRPGKNMFIHETYAYKTLEKKGKEKSNVSQFNCYFTKMIKYGFNGYLTKYNWPNTYFLILSLHQGTLLDYLNPYNMKNSFILEGQFKLFFIQMIKSLLFMHSHSKEAAGIYHRDIKLENILFSDSGIKICDFGLSTLKGQPISGQRGTITNMAPEIYDNQSENGEKIDVFATGVVLFQLIFRQNPFPHADLHQRTSYPYSLLASKNSSENQEFWQVFDKIRAIGNDIKDLLEQMLHPDPDQRISVEEITHHPWIACEFHENTRFPKTKSIKKSKKRCVEELKSSESIQEDPQHPSLEQVIVVTAQEGYELRSKDLQFPSYQESNFDLIKNQLADVALFFNKSEAEDYLIQKCVMTEVKDEATQKIKNLKVVISLQEILENANDENIREKEKREEELKQVLNINLTPEQVVSAFLITVVKYEDIINERFLKFELVEGSELMLFNFMDKFVDLIEWD